MPLPEPEVRVEYHLEYRLPDGPEEWTNHATLPASPADTVKTAIKGMRDMTPGWEWRVMKYEIIEQVMDW